MCKDWRGLGAKLVSFAKTLSKRPHILPIFKVVSEYLRFSFKLKVDYFILYLILVSSGFVNFSSFFAINKSIKETNDISLYFSLNDRL